MSFSVFKVLWVLNDAVQISRIFKKEKKADAFIQKGRSKGYKVLFFGF